MGTNQTTPASQQTGAVGQGDYVVVQGDCVESVAFEHGLFWKSVWDDPENAELKRVRQDPNRLLPGDRLHLLEKRLKLVDAGTEQRHRFRRKGVPSQIHVVLKQGGKPRAHVRYVLDVDGALFSDATNAQGELTHPIPPNARLAKIKFGPPDQQQEIDLPLGHMDPITEMTGVQGRLTNLGYRCGPIDGQLSAATAAALAAFQRDAGLPPTGELDQPTRDALAQAHAS